MTAQEQADMTENGKHHMWSHNGLQT